MFRTPAASKTARTGPPAITPVPSIAGLSSTQPAPKCPSTSCGMVCPKSGTLKRFFFAFSPPLRIASGTSLAFPSPTPTWPAPSPTTTSAAKENRRPPLTTLATRLMLTTRSVRSRSLGLIGVATFQCSFRLEFQAGFSRRLRHRGDPPMVGETVAIENHRFHLSRLALLRDQLSHPLGIRLLVPLLTAALELLGKGRCKRHRLAARIVDDLGVDVIEAPIDGQPRPHGRARQLPANSRFSLQ